VVGDDGGNLQWDGPAYDNGPPCDNGPIYDCGSDCDCGCPDYGQSWALTDGFFCQPGQFFVGGEYLYVRASPSEATSYLEQNTTELETAPFDRLHQLDFKHESSFRFYGGYRLCKCGEEIRWTYTQFDSSAETDIPASTNTVEIHVPFEVVAIPEGGGSIATGDVSVRSGDLEFAKTIPLGGPLCCDCGCGDSCGGCGDCCDCPCPTWDITWSGGLRFASADLERRYVTFDADQTVLTNAHSTVSFDGGGPRFGLEGRRYFGRDGWCSVYLKSNISLLLGNVNIVSRRTSIEDPGQVVSQYFRNRNIIPVTEIEAGMTSQITKHTKLSAGYLFAAWHDLGFREEFNFPTNFGVSYDDANILGFDGLFIRLEADF
jgi:Legionella pneumophila major outer membrane protein precursor